MDRHIEAINAAVDHSRNAKTAEEKQLAANEFWTAAINAFNEEIAGDVTLVDGTVITMPKIEI